MQPLAYPFIFSPQPTVGILCFLLLGISYLLFQECPFTPLLLWIPPNISSLSGPPCLHQAVAHKGSRNLSIARKRTLSEVFMWYMDLYSSYFYTLNYRTFPSSLQSSCKELHRRWFDCTATNFIGLGNPRDYTTQWAPSTGIQLFIHVCGYKALLYSWTEKSLFFKELFFFFFSDLQLVFCSVHCMIIGTILAGRGKKLPWYLKYTIVNANIHVI